MTSKTDFSKKSPFFAGLLSLIPGLGQIYNEQRGKGLFLMFLFFFSLFLLVTGGFPLFSMSSGQFILQNDAFGWGHDSLSGIIQHSEFNFDRRMFIDYYPLFWSLLIVPMFYVFSISDAVSTARDHNKQILAQQLAASNPTPGTAPPQEPTVAAATEQAVPHAASMPGMDFSQKTVHESPSSDQPTGSAVPPPFPSAQKTHRHSSKFLIGLILVAIGGLTVVNEMNLFFLSWEHLWPFIPLLFGMRLLRDYRHDRDQGQFILGILFTSLGSVFFLENWRLAHPWRWVSHHWEIALLAMGIILIFHDLLERRKREQR